MIFLFFKKAKKVKNINNTYCSLLINFGYSCIKQHVTNIWTQLWGQNFD